MPRSVHQHPGVAALGRNWVISAVDAGDISSARLLADEVRTSYGWNWPIVAIERSQPSVELRVGAAGEHDSELYRQQGYRIEVTARHIVIEGNSAEGRFYGVQTLRQLMRASPTGELPCLSINDSPALAWRGVSDDISRGQISTLEDFKAIVRQLAYYKINLYQPYIENVFDFGAAAAGDSARAHLSSSDLEALAKLGRENHVVVCPVFETLAHQEQMLGRPENQRYAAQMGRRSEGGAAISLWDQFVAAAAAVRARLIPADRSPAAVAASFSTVDPAALEFVESMIDQIASATRAPFFHVGGDEWNPPGVNAGSSPADEARAASAYGAYLGSLQRHLHDRFGCRTMVYGDVALRYPAAAADMPHDLMVVDWHYDPADSFPSLDSLQALGFHDVIVSPGLWNWRTFYPNYARGCRSISEFVRAGKLHDASGCVVASWGDDGAENLRENNWLGYAFAGAAAWQADAPDTATFAARFVTTQFGIDSPDLARAETLLGWQEFDGVGWAGRLFHRAPIVRPRGDAWVERMRRLQSDMREAGRGFALGDSAAHYNREQLAAARHAVNRFSYVAERELLLDSLGTALRGGTLQALPPMARAEVVQRLMRLSGMADSLEAEYGGLWLRTNQPDGLAENQRRLAQQGVMLDRLIGLARSGRLTVDDSYSKLQARGTTN